jgi:hypothetical protein
VTKSWGMGQLAQGVRMEKVTNAYIISVTQPEGKWTLKRPAMNRVQWRAFVKTVIGRVCFNQLPLVPLDFTLYVCSEPNVFP